MKKKIIALCGSTRAASTNHRLIQAIASLSAELFTIELLEGIDSLPHFNPDLNGEQTPEAITEFRKRLNDADGILICTPEYAMGVPGTLKNAIDWTVSSMEFSQKPVALITASSLGQKAHLSLIETLKVIEAKMLPETQVLISFAQSKVSDTPEITDNESLMACKQLVFSLNELMEQQKRLAS